ncbi:MAG: rhomboid family intramembrane serine protease [Lachnospiraceae bacterium]|nr:rhomboid family intramembrane serine protease [Lachnospiraceae bacterium]
MNFIDNCIELFYRFDYEEISINTDDYKLLGKQFSDSYRVVIISRRVDANKGKLLHFNDIIKKQCEDNGFSSVKCFNIIIFSDKYEYNDFFISDNEDYAFLLLLAEEGRIISHRILYENNCFMVMKKEIKQSQELADSYKNDDSYKEFRDERNIKRDFGNMLKSPLLKSAIFYLAILNVIVFLVINVIIFIINPVTFVNIIDNGASGYNVVIKEGQIYRLFTAMFLHADFNHILSNMITLVAIGMFLEKSIGKKRVLFIYFSSGIIAGLVSLSYNNIMGRPDSTSIGASGAIFGLVGGMAAVMIIGRKQFGDVGLKRLLVYCLLTIYSGMNSEGIDNAAHVGGFFAGLIITMVIIKIIIKQNKRKRGLYEG